MVRKTCLFHFAAVVVAAVHVHVVLLLCLAFLGLLLHVAEVPGEGQVDVASAAPEFLVACELVGNGNVAELACVEEVAAVERNGEFPVEEGLSQSGIETEV